MNLSTVKLSTVKLSTVKLSTVNLSTVNLSTVNLSSLEVRFQRYPLLLLLVALASGIVVERSLLPRIPAPLWLGLGIASIVGWFLLYRRSGYAWFLLCLAWAAVGAARHREHWNLYPQRDVAHWALEDEQPVAIRIRLQTLPEASPLAEPDPFSTIPLGVQSRFDAEVLEVRDHQTWGAACGRVAVRVNGHVLQQAVGDVVEVYGTLSRLPAPQNPGAPDRRTSQRDRRTLCRLRVSHPDCIQPIRRNGHSLSSWIGALRHRGLTLLDTHVGQEYSGLAGALLLGARDRLSYDRVEQFFHTGTIHLLAISGLHVGILAWAFFFLAARSPARKKILLLLMLGTVVYCHLTGLRAPVLRASVLVILVCVGSLWHRKFSALNALSAAAILILLFRPSALVLPGAQLSFLAVTTLIWIAHTTTVPSVEPLEKLVRASRSVWQRSIASLFRRTWQLALVGFSIWLVALPLVMFWFHLCSPVALVLNVLLAFPITVGLLSGFGVLLCGAWLSPLADVLGQICAGSLMLVEWAIQFSHTVPGAYFWVCETSWVWCSVFYLGLLGLHLAPWLHFNQRLAIAWLAVWIALPIVGQWVEASTTDGPGALRCTFLSVGHGTCTVVEMPDGRVMLYDAGRMGVPSSGVEIVSEFLWSRGISHVDAVVISHADADHYNIVPSLLDRFSIGEVFVSARMWIRASPGVALLRQTIDEAQIPIRNLQTNDVLRFGPAQARVLHPFSTGVPGSDNANSIVLEVTYQGRRILLPGDLESPGLEDVMAEQPRDVDLVMAPHHGSLRSDPEGFTGWCTPEFVVISGGRATESWQQRRKFAQTGANVLHTAYDGAVTATISASHFQVESWNASFTRPIH